MPKTATERKQYNKWRREHRIANIDVYLEREQRFRDRHRKKLNAKKREERKTKPHIERNARLLYRYGITIAQYDKLLVEQKSRCKICRKKGVKLHVDHCHETHKVRGLLCTQCNRAIGLMGESVRAIRRAADYLEGAL